MAYGRIQNLSYDFQELYTNKRMTRFCFAVIIVSFLVILQIILAFSMHSVGWMGNSLASVIVNKNGLRHWNYVQIGDLNFGGVGTRSANLQSVDELLNDKDVRILSFCHQDWHGIRQASYGQKFPVIEVKDFYNDKQLNNLLLLFSNMPHLEIILVNGIPFGAIKFAKKVKQKFPDIQVLFIYHGSLAQMFHDAEADVVNEMITATQDGVPGYGVFSFFRGGVGVSLGGGFTSSFTGESTTSSFLGGLLCCGVVDVPSQACLVYDCGASTGVLSTQFTSRFYQAGGVVVPC
ncbi:hypothetical protein MIR68_005553 [Amoeboaphelidium protococcarum]|nr:hypothetical protein MIR68_005553 [Amoeboaphelidium protococcarum]